MPTSEPPKLGTTEYTKVSFDLAELSQIKSAVLDGRPYSDRTSVAFITRLIQAADEGLGYYQIIDELDFLEGLRTRSKTKPAERFKGAILRPFWHKHFTTARHIQKNIGDRWALDRGGNRDLDRLLGRIAKRGGENWINILCHEMIVGGFQSRAQTRRLTGDWIIFAKYRRKNYYLDLATHGEAKDEQALMEKLRKGNEAEFPFVFKQAVARMSAATSGGQPQHA